MPFSGGISSSSDSNEKALVVMLAQDRNILNTFTLLTGPENFNRVLAERQILAAPDRAGLFSAAFALLVRVEYFDHNNLAIIELVNTATLQLTAGGYCPFKTKQDIINQLPAITQKIAKAASAKTSAYQPQLAVLPFYSPDSTRTETFSQLVSIEIANSGLFTVVPWALTSTLSSNSMSRIEGVSSSRDDIRMVRRLTNAPYVLVGSVLRDGTTNLILSAILSTDNAASISDSHKMYRDVADDIQVVSELALELTAITLPTLGKKSFIQTVEVPEGIFMMGSPNLEVGRDDDETQHQVIVSSFAIGIYEVTQREYETVMGTNPSRFRGLDLPVEQVSWFDAILYCNALSVKEGLTPAYTIADEEEILWDHRANGYRLPTESEWEYACRAGTGTAFNRGNNITTEQSNYDGNYPYRKGGFENYQKGQYHAITMPVGSFAPNAWGLFDMHGNVFEWCWNQYKPYDEVEDLNGLLSNDSVIRGGGWDSEARFLRSAKRVHVPHTTKSSYIGFRVVRSVE
jgi:formylglycine-generating enzyme required for sulfatase activity